MEENKKARFSEEAKKKKNERHLWNQSKTKKE